MVILFMLLFFFMLFIYFNLKGQWKMFIFQSGLFRWLPLPFMGINYLRASYVGTLLLANINWLLAYSSKKD